MGMYRQGTRLDRDCSQLGRALNFRSSEIACCRWLLCGAFYGKVIGYLRRDD